jgi:hypothetical protein
MPNGKRRVRVRLKGINTIRHLNANGEEMVYRYYRGTGQKLEGEPGTPEFLQSYAAAERASKDRANGTFSDLIRVPSRVGGN